MLMLPGISQRREIILGMIATSGCIREHLTECTTGGNPQRYPRANRIDYLLN